MPGSSKIKVKVGPLEVEFEGSEGFLRKELPKLLATIAKLYDTKELPEAPEDEQPATGGKRTRAGGKLASRTTNSIAAKLAVKSGSDLAIAAIAKGVLIDGKETVSRRDVLNEMREATSFFKANYRSNLTKILRTLVSTERINETAKHTYALPTEEERRLRTALGS